MPQLTNTLSEAERHISGAVLGVRDATVRRLRPCLTRGARREQRSEGGRSVCRLTVFVQGMTRCQQRIADWLNDSLATFALAGVFQQVAGEGFWHLKSTSTLPSRNESRAT
jgi:hypothetical protein